MSTRFVTQLSKKDIKEYAETVVCGSIYDVVSPIVTEKIYDKSGDVRCVYVHFSAISHLTGQRTRRELFLSDFDSVDISHNKFMLEKFGLSYLDAFRYYVKDIDTPDLKKENNFALKYLEKQYYKKILSDRKQKSLFDYMENDKSK